MDSIQSPILPPTNPPPLRVNDHLAYIYPVLATCDSSPPESDLIGLTYLSSVDPVGPEIRCNVSPNMSRIIMRTCNATIQASGVSNGCIPAVCSAWECLDVPLSVSRGFVRLFAEWQPPRDDARKEAIGIRREFLLGVKPFFRVKSCS